jgi:hypothetical protein
MRSRRAGSVRGGRRLLPDTSTTSRVIASRSAPPGPNGRADKPGLLTVASARRAGMPLSLLWRSQLLPPGPKGLGADGSLKYTCSYSGEGASKYYS